MAEKRADPAAEKKQADSKKHKESQKAPPSSLPVIIAIVIVGIAVLIALFLVVPSTLTGVSFSSFKSNFDAAPRVAIVATYYNASQYPIESSCFDSIIQIIAHSRKASTIDFFLINGTTHECIYSKTGLGGQISPVTANASSCLSTAYSEPSIFLNYSGFNSTIIHASRIYVYGNAPYMTECPISVNLA
ncbi:MAG: hypothetical protein KGH72_01365 [Candidatus Micrarchaeota archaeon]|nr:hypothetical protein [Candidatus Micrarchaeota archaeon]